MTEWIISENPKRYDVINAFRNLRTICHGPGKVIKENAAGHLADMLKDVSHSLQQALLILTAKYLAVRLVAIRKRHGKF